MTVVAESTRRDFTQIKDLHREIADYVNMNSGLPPVTPEQVKAVLALRIEHMKSPERAAVRAEQQARRDQAKRDRAAAEARYAGLTEIQKAAVKKAERAAAAAEKARAAAQALLP